MSSVKLVSLSLGELLDHTFSYYRRQFLLFGGIMALPLVVLSGLDVLAEVIEIGMATRLFALLIVHTLAYATAFGATTYALSETYLGRATTVRGSYLIIQQKLGPLLRVVISILVRFAVLFLPAFAVFATAVLPRTPLFKSGGPLLAAFIAIGTKVCEMPALSFVSRYGVAVPACCSKTLIPATPSSGVCS
jgi:hypothetical protein